MTLDREQAIGDIERSAREIFRAVWRLTTLDWLGLELSMAQLKTLLALAGREPMTVGALGQMLQIQLPAASHAAKGLVRLGLARRLKDPNDLRCTYVQLTPYAEELAQQLREGRREALRSLLAELSDEDLVAALRGLQAMAAVAARDAGSSGPTALAAGRGGLGGSESFGPCFTGPDIRILVEENS
jgi:DNA-binding MarR family transcriptional regulator